MGNLLHRPEVAADSGGTDPESKSAGVVTDGIAESEARREERA